MGSQIDESRCFEDVSIGAEIPPLVKAPNEVQLFCFSAVTWDTHRTHFDTPFAKEVDRLPGILVHGHLQAAFLGQLLTSWGGPRSRLLRLEYQNRGMSIAGDRLTCAGRVVSKGVEAGKSVVTCEVWVKNQRGETITAGEGVIQLPARG